MKKLWIYLAMPVALLNGCQRQQALLDEAGSLAMESPKDSGQQDGAAKDQEETGREQDGTVKDQKETWDESLPQGSGGKPASVVLSQNSVREAAFEGSTVSLVRSVKEEASAIEIGRASCRERV